MAGEIVGAAKQLVALLRRHFHGSGFPPQPPRFEYRCPIGMVEDGKANTGEFGRKIDASLESLSFRSLLADSDDVREITGNIQVISDVSRALREVVRHISHERAESARFAYLFGCLCDRQWASDLGIRVAVEDGVPTNQVWQYWLQTIEPEFLDDLEAAIQEISGVTDMSRDTDAGTVTTAEQNIIEALGTLELTGPQIAVKSGYEYGSRLRENLSRMVKAGKLKKTRHGYRVP